MTAIDPLQTFAMSVSGQDSQPLGGVFVFIGVAIAGTIWVLLVIWVVSFFGFDPEGPIEDIIGTRSGFVIALIAIPNAILIALSGEFIGKVIRSQVSKLRQ